MSIASATDLASFEGGRHHRAVEEPAEKDHGQPPSEHGSQDPAEHGSLETEATGHGVGCANDASRSVAVGMIATIILTPVGMHMLLTPGVKKYVMLKMLDQCMTIYVAVLWFTVYSDFISHLKLYDYIPVSAVIVSFSQVFVLDILALFFAKAMSDSTLASATICSLGAHYVAFTAIGAAGPVQQGAAELGGTWMSSIGIMLVVMVGLLLLGGLFEFCVIGRPSSYSEEWIRTTGLQIDEMQMEIIGLVGSFLIIQAVRHGITGRYPPLRLGRLAEGEGGGHSAHDDYTHKKWQRTFMLLWSIGFTLVAMYVVPKLNRMAAGSRNTRKVVHGLKVLLIMLVAWGFLLWGQWLFYESVFHGDVMFGHMVFALIATSISFAFVFLMSGAIEKDSARNDAHRGSSESEGSESVGSSIRQSHGVTITGVSLLTAWSWEHAFHVAFDTIAEHYQVGYGGLPPKTFLAILIPCVVLPVYVMHVKPRVLEEERKNDPEADIMAA